MLQERESERRRRDVIDPRGFCVAQLCVDSVAYRVAGMTLQHHEVEIEAAAGEGPKLLELLAGALVAAFPTELQLWLPSKLVTGFALEALARRGNVELAGPGADLLPSIYPLLLAELERI